MSIPNLSQTKPRNCMTMMDALDLMTSIDLSKDEPNARLYLSLDDALYCYGMSKMPVVKEVNTFA